MQYRKLGVSHLKVSVLSFGAWQLGDQAYWGGGTPYRPLEAVRAALDSGINLFDTAEVYGNGESERVLGKALGADRKRVLVATKVLPQNCTPDRLRASCEASLRRLGTDYIDLYQIHWPFRQKPVRDLQGNPLAVPLTHSVRSSAEMAMARTMPGMAMSCLCSCEPSAWRCCTKMRGASLLVGASFLSSIGTPATTVQPCAGDWMMMSVP